MTRDAILISLIVVASPAWADVREDKVAKYIKDFDSKDAKTRATAAEEIGNIAAVKASYGKPAVDPMIKLLKDKDADVRAAAARALGKLDEPSKVVPELIKVLKEDKSDKAKMGAAAGLGAVGEPAREAVKSLRATAEAARKDMNMQLAQSCRRAIEAINAGRKKN